MSAPKGYTAIIDGYNVIKQHPAWCELPLATARQYLVTALQETRWPVPVSQVEVVFDTANPSEAAGVQAAPIRVTFAAPTADAAIQRMIQTSPAPERLVVISNDREILRTAQSHGTLRYSVAWLMRRSRPKPVASVHASTPQGFQLPQAEIQRINEELARRWGVSSGND